MEDFEEAIKYYEKRVSLTYMGYYEELFISYLKLADLNDIIGKHDRVCQRWKFAPFAVQFGPVCAIWCGLCAKSFSNAWFAGSALHEPSAAHAPTPRGAHAATR